MSDYARCPQCEEQNAEKVGFTWWGGAIGPRLMHHVRCRGCRTQYNGRTGKSNSGAIGVYVVVTALIVVGVMLFAMQS
jgi:hypothetical protein